MTDSGRDELREFVRQARELRLSEQPPSELFDATLARLAHEEQSGGLSCGGGVRGNFVHWRAVSALRRALVEVHPARLGLALALALGALWVWGARHRPPTSSHQDEPVVALSSEPPASQGPSARSEPTELERDDAPDLSRGNDVEPGEDVESPAPRNERASDERASDQRASKAPVAKSPGPPKASEAPKPIDDLLAIPAPPRSPSSGPRRLEFGGEPFEDFRVVAPPVAIVNLRRTKARRPPRSAPGPRLERRPVDGVWALRSWILLGAPPPVVVDDVGDRQCIDVERNQTLVLGWISREGPGRRSFELKGGHRYRLVLRDVSVVVSTPLELIAKVGGGL